MPSNRGPATEGVTIAFVILATIFVAARFFTRAFLVRSVKQDDWWILAAWIVAVGFSTAICIGVRYGLGQHADATPAEWDLPLRKSEYAFSVLYNPALMLTKTSILVFYLSVMSKDVDPVFKWCTWLTLALVNVAGLALTFLNTFQCRPVGAAFTSPTPAGAKCADILALYLSSAPVNIITDIAILLLPMPVLSGMRLPKKQKIILLITFGFGGFVAVVDVIRIASLQSAALSRLTVTTDNTGTTSRVTEERDFPWYAAFSFMWSAVEVNIGIICACVPSLKPLFVRFMPTVIRDVTDPPSQHGSFDEGMQGEKALSPPSNANPINNPAAFRSPSVAEYLGDDDGDAMGFLNFLQQGPTGEDGDAATVRTKSTRFSRVTRVGTNQSQKSTVSDFDFVRMDKNRNMLKLNNRQSIWPVAVVTIIFFLWGFAYGLLNSLNGRFQTIAKLTEAQTYGLHAAYFGGYLIGPLTLGQFILKRYGFKATMMAGLCVYGCGTLVFWPSAVLTSYPAFIISNLIVGFGLSCLEIAANPYTALCGPLEYAEVRLNLSQAFQAVGTVCSPLLATKVLFKDVSNAPSLVDVQWAYLGIAIFVFALAVVFYYIPLPEATDDDFEEQADRRSAAYRTHIGPWPVVWVTLALGVFAQWCYVGAQEGVGSTVEALMGPLHPNPRLIPFDYETIAHTVFAVGRFLSAFLNYLITPRWILMVLFIGCTVCTGLQTMLTGDAAAGVLMLTYLFEAGIFSIIFAMCMRGMGAHTKTASAYMTAAISGGAVIPVIQWKVSQTRGWPHSYSVLAGVFGVACIFPIYLNFVPAARNHVDPLHEKERRRRGVVRQESYLSDPGAETREFGLKGIIARRQKKKHLADKVSAQHIERSSQESGIEAETISHDFGGKFDSVVHMPSPPPVHARVEKQKTKAGEVASWPGMRGISESSGSARSSIDSISSDGSSSVESVTEMYAAMHRTASRTSHVSRHSRRDSRSNNVHRSSSNNNIHRSSSNNNIHRSRNNNNNVASSGSGSGSSNGNNNNNNYEDAFAIPKNQIPANTGENIAESSTSPNREERPPQMDEETFDALKNAQPKREWTEKDDVIDDYHKALRGL